MSSPVVQEKRSGESAPRSGDALGNLLSSQMAEQLKTSFPTRTTKEALNQQFAQRYGIPDSYSTSAEPIKRLIWKYTAAIGGQNAEAHQALLKELNALPEQERKALADQIALDKNLSPRTKFLLADLQKLLRSEITPIKENVTKEEHQGNALDAATVMADYRKIIELQDADALAKWTKQLSSLDPAAVMALRKGLQEAIRNEPEMRKKLQISTVITSYLPE